MAEQNRFPEVTLTIPEGSKVTFNSGAETAESDRVYVRFGLYDVTIIKTDEGIVVDVWPSTPGIAAGLDEPLATTYAFDSDADTSPDDEND